MVDWMSALKSVDIAAFSSSVTGLAWSVLVDGGLDCAVLSALSDDCNRLSSNLSEFLSEVERFSCGI